MSDKDYVKIAVLDNEIQARFVDAALTDQGIPHVMQSYHDSALNGLYQAQKGWGHVSAPEELRVKVQETVDDLRSEVDEGAVPDGE